MLLSLMAIVLHAGNRMHASQSAQRLGSSGDASTSGRPSVDSEASSQTANRNQQQLPHNGAMTASSSTNSLNNLPMTQPPQHDLSRRQHDEDIFSVVGGCELGVDSRQHPLQQANNASTNSLGSAAGLPNSSSVGNLSRMGDGALEEQPSRILFVRGLDATVSDEALVHMFEVRETPRASNAALTRHSGCCVHSVLHFACGTDAWHVQSAPRNVKHPSILHCLLLQVVAICSGVHYDLLLSFVNLCRHMVRSGLCTQLASLVALLCCPSMTCEHPAWLFMPCKEHALAPATCTSASLPPRTTWETRMRIKVDLHFLLPDQAFVKHQLICMAALRASSPSSCCLVFASCCVETHLFALG